MKILIALLAVALLAGAALLVAIRTNGPAVLNALDRVTGGSRDVALVARTTYGEHPAQKLRIYAPADAAGLAPQYGGDPARIVIAGHSAGAYNVVQVALEERWLAASGVRPVGVIGLSGPYD